MAAVDSRRAVHHHNGSFLIFLVFSCLLSAVLAVPATRSLRSIKAHSSIQGTAAIPQLWKRRSAEESNVWEGRMDVELTDYPGTGANKGHEPVTPSTKG
ncbi:hypothetical protein QQ045_022003 [Rhodiola kirilowii]